MHAQSLAVRTTAAPMYYSGTTYSKGNMPRLTHAEDTSVSSAAGASRERSSNCIRHTFTDSSVALNAVVLA